MCCVHANEQVPHLSGSEGYDGHLRLRDQLHMVGRLQLLAADWNLPVLLDAQNCPVQQRCDTAQGQLAQARPSMG